MIIMSELDMSCETSLLLFIERNLCTVSLTTSVGIFVNNLTTTAFVGFKYVCVVVATRVIPLGYNLLSTTKSLVEGISFSIAASFPAFVNNFSTAALGIF